MATTFIGIHAVCAFAGANQNQLDILRKPEWAHSVAQAEIVGGSYNSPYTAPEIHKTYGEPTFKLRAIGTDIWVTVGATPEDPTLATAKREFIASGTERLFAVSQNDKFRWAVAA